MNPKLNAEQVRARLHELLQETDPGRPLDSVETVVVLSFLRGNGLEPADSESSAPDAPSTIEGWAAWAERHSPGS